MTVKDVRKVVRQIKAKIHDEEIAHGIEDELYIDVLTAIANGTCDDPVACAKAALKSQDLQFPRYTA